MNEKRFGCPQCGQHYTVESASQEAAITYVTCGREFMIAHDDKLRGAGDTGGRPDDVFKLWPSHCESGF